MESVESNKVSVTVALDQARAWKDKGATLVLSISRGSDKQAVVFDKLLVSVLDVKDLSLAFSWRLLDPTLPFETEGRIVVRLEGASFSMLDTPQKSMTISLSPYQCVLVEARASAFAEMWQTRS